MAWQTCAPGAPRKREELGMQTQSERTERVALLCAVVAVSTRRLTWVAARHLQAARGRPMVGRVPGTRGLYVAAGHEGSGLTLAPMSAHILAAQILSGAHEPDQSLSAIEQYLAPAAAA